MGGENGALDVNVRVGAYVLGVIVGFPAHVLSVLVGLLHDVARLILCVAHSVLGLGHKLVALVVRLALDAVCGAVRLGDRAHDQLLLIPELFYLGLKLFNALPELFVFGAAFIKLLLKLLCLSSKHTDPSRSIEK